MNENQLAKKLRDQLNNITVRKTTQCAMQALDAIQGYPKDQRLAGLCMAFQRACVASNLPAQDVHTIIDNVTKAALDEKRPEVNGLVNYFKNSK